MTNEVKRYLQEQFQQMELTMLPEHWPDFETKKEVDDWVLFCTILLETCHEPESATLKSKKLSPLKFFNKIGFLQKWLYPERCTLCDVILSRNTINGFCFECFKNLKRIEEPTCIKCGKATAGIHILKKGICDFCLGKENSLLLKNISVLPYAGEVRNAIHRFKFGGRTDYTLAFAALMAEKFNSEYVKKRMLIIPVPLNSSRKCERGYNQAELLASGLAYITGAEYTSSSLVRIKKTIPMCGLNYELKIENVSNAFYAVDSTSISGRNILLIDDIYTTGSTLDACANALIRAGAKDVYGLCLATTAI